MLLGKTERLILYSLSEFYKSINQPLTATPLKLRTSKIAFIELLIEAKVISQQKRAVYKNLEALEEKKLIAYDKRMIKLTEKGLEILDKINQEVNQFVKIKDYFKDAKRPKRKLQTVIS